MRQKPTARISTAVIIPAACHHQLLIHGRRFIAILIEVLRQQISPF